jgi:hypothetical protein
MIFNDHTLTPDLVQKLIFEIESMDNLNRKRRAWISNQIREGALWQYVRERIKQMYPKNYSLYTISEYSILKKVVDKKARAYKKQPIRKTDSDDTYPMLVKEWGLDQAMATLDQEYCEHKYGLLAALMDVDAQGNPIHKFFACSPWEFDCVFDADGNLKIVVLSYAPQYVKNTATDGVNTLIAEQGSTDEGANKRVYTFWTANEHFQVNVSGPMGDINRTKIETVFTDSNGVNPYGVLPFVYCPMTMDVNYPVASPLPSQTVELNALMSVYLTSANMQIGTLVLKYPSDQPINTVSGSLYSTISLPQSKNPDDKTTDATYIAPTPNLAGHKDAVMTYAQAILDEQGITQSAIAGNQEFSSGLDRLIAQADVQEVIESNQELYRKVEQVVFEIVKAQRERVAMPISAEELTVIYQRPKVLVSDSEILDNIAKMKNLGIFQDYELLQAFDPNLTEDQAKEKIAAIQSARNEIMGAIIGNE